MEGKRKIRWGMLCSHHPPSQYNRTYHFCGIRLCARCTGILIGFVIGIAFFTYYNIANVYQSIALTYIASFCFMNYLFQEINKIENSNGYRTFTGILLGLGMGRHFILLLHWQYFNYVLIYFTALLTYMALVVWVLARYKRIDAIVEEYEVGVYKN